VYGYDLGREVSTVVSVVAVSICLIIVLNFFFNSEETSFFFRFKPWINIDTLLVDFGFMVDEVSLIMLFVILFVSLMVHFFSVEYMYNDPAYIKFMSYLNLFTAFMIVLVTADNLVLIFVG